MQVTTITSCRRCHIYSRDAGGYTPLIGGPFPGPGGSGNGPGGRTGVAGVECYQKEMITNRRTPRILASTVSLSAGIGFLLEKFVFIFNYNPMPLQKRVSEDYLNRKDHATYEMTTMIHTSTTRILYPHLLQIPKKEGSHSGQ
ncbi:hypothetical protein [Methanosphaerula subterraneus]|uniref:hypothetical protein n=1 Tax=Methanosphaerula subterraneus TaxID=3350244 RepID=UPI003F8671A6